MTFDTTVISGGGGGGGGGGDDDDGADADLARAGAGELERAGAVQAARVALPGGGGGGRAETVERRAQLPAQRRRLATGRRTGQRPLHRPAVRRRRHRVQQGQLRRPQLLADGHRKRRRIRLESRRLNALLHHRIHHRRSVHTVSIFSLFTH